MRSLIALTFGVSLLVLSPGMNAHADVTNNALTNNALTNNALTNNALTNNALTNNALTNNAITSNALSGNAVVDHVAGAAVSELNGVGVEGVVLPAQTR